MSSGTTDYYKVLGVSRTATADEIRRAYRDLARKHHPDVSTAPDAAERFSAIHEAYEVLSDAEKRKAYDQFGRVGGRAPGAGGRPGGAHVNVNFEDIFSEFFGGGRSPFDGGGFGPGGPRSGGRPAPPQRGEDLTRTVQVTFMTAAHGGRETLRLHTDAGEVKTIEVRIPAGVEDGAKLRVKGEGRPGAQGGPAGDLIVTVKVGAHPWFRRDGLDLLLDVPLTIAEAALGAAVEAPLLKGAVTLRVPPGTSSGAKIRVPAQGLKGPGDERGDFYAVVRIVAPKSLTPDARTALEQLAPSLDNPRSGAPWTGTDD